MWAAAELLHPGIKTGWLVHHTDEGYPIRRHGFTKGVDDVYRLLLTTMVGEYEKHGPGYNFAFEPGDVARFSMDRGRRKYGENTIIFRAPYVHVWHEWDEEPQAIFWGPDATDITLAWEDDGCFYIEGSDDEELEFSSLDAVLDYLESEMR